MTSEGHRDRLFSQVPRSLSPWMDGPYVKKMAEKWGISIGAAKQRIKTKEQRKSK